MRAEGETLHYVAATRAGPGASSFVVDALCGAVPLALIVSALAMWRAHRRRGRAERAEAGRPPAALRRGGAVVSGVVVDPGDGQPAVTVEIEQRGRERQRRGRWHTTWIEKSRTVSARPFYVQRSDGSRVRVEPDRHVFLVDKLDFTEQRGADARVRRARLTAGEPVHVVGVLAPGADRDAANYRDAGLTLILRPPRVGRMLISTEPLERRHFRRARIFFGWAAALAAMLVLLHVGVFGRFHLLRLAGQVFEAGGLRVRIEPDGEHAPRYFVAGEIRDDAEVPWSVEDEVDEGLGEEVSDGDVKRAPFLVVPQRAWVHEVGTRATVERARLWAGLGIVLAWMLLYWAGVAAARPWYERSKVVERSSGRLQE